MKITWIGHACFKIEEKGYVLVTDPYAPGSVPGLSGIKETADSVFCSHEHGDHNFREAVSIRKNGGTAPGITEVHSFHDEVKGAKRGQNIIRIFDFGGKKIAHLGDIGCELPEEQKQMLIGMDVLMIPVGGTYTIDGTQAAALIKELKPRLAIPMHFRSGKLHFGFPVIAEVNAFLGAAQTEWAEAGSDIDPDLYFPVTGKTKIIVMTPQNRL